MTPTVTNTFKNEIGSWGNGTAPGEGFSRETFEITLGAKRGMDTIAAKPTGDNVNSSLASV